MEISAIIRRTLVTIAAMLGYGNTSANIQVLIRSDWLEMLKFQLHPQDIVVCWDEPRTGLWTPPLSRLRLSNLKVTLYSRVTWKKAAAARIDFIVTIVDFLVLEIKICQLANQ